MISDRDVNRGQERKPALKRGDVILTKMSGKPMEAVLVSGVYGEMVGMVNLKEGRPFVTSLNRVDSGKMGKSEIVSSEVSTVNNGQVSRDQDPDMAARLGTDMVVVTSKGSKGSKGSKEEVLMVVTGLDEGSVVLSSPEKPDRQMLKIPEDELMRGESGDLTFRTVDLKFSLLKESSKLDEELEKKRKEKINTERPVVECPGGFRSRDVDVAIAVGEMLPNRTTEERLKEPDAIFQRGMALAVRTMIENGEAKALVAAMALSFGNLARLSMLDK